MQNTTCQFGPIGTVVLVFQHKNPVCEKSSGIDPVITKDKNIGEFIIKLSL